MLKKIKHLLREFNTCITYTHNIHTNYSVFSPESILILEFLFEQYDQKIKYSYLSSSQIAAQIGADEITVSRHLRMLSKFGILLVVQEEYKQQIHLNPTLHACLTYANYTKSLKTIVNHYVSIGLSRSEFERPIQGFRSDTLYGCVEVENSGTIKAEEEVCRIVSRYDEKKARQEEDRQLWRALGVDLIEGCSKIWRMAQSAQGNAIDVPIWALDQSTIPKSAMSERRELIKAFQTYGGRVTALTWSVFCGGITELDAFGKPVFDIRAPHRQWVSWDRKPSQFTKHFNSILKDPETIKWAKTKWHDLYPILKKLFGDCLDVEPKMGEDLILSGLEFEQIN